MKKSIKVIIVVLVIIIACLFGGKIVNGVYYTYAKITTLQYLCEKYNEKTSAFEVLDYNKPHHYWRDTGVFSVERVWVDFSIQYKYNDREFFVTRKNKVLYDDYQFEDVENWCTEWLKENVDERITGFYLYEDNIRRYLTSCAKGYRYVIQESDAQDILENCFNSTESAIFVYYDSYGRMSKEEEMNLTRIITNKLHCIQYCGVYYSGFETMKINQSKFIHDNWEKYCELENNINALTQDDNYISISSFLESAIFA